MKKIVWIPAGIVALALAAFVLFKLSFPKPAKTCQVLAHWGEEGHAPENLYHPMGIAWGGGILYVADTENRAIKLYQNDGSFVAHWRGFKRPVDVAATDKAVYVADFITDQISMFGHDGTLLTSWGEHGVKGGQFDAPAGIATDHFGNVYVTDFYNHRVQKFTANGKFLLQWGKNGGGNGEFHYPTGIAVNRQGEILVADAYNQRIQKFTDKGELITRWGGIGFGLSGPWPGWFRLAKDVAISPESEVYVADAFNHRVQKFTTDGQLLAIWDNREAKGTPIMYPAGITVDQEGILYLSDYFDNRIWKLDCR